MTHVVDLLDIDGLEAGLRAGTLSDKEKFYSEVAQQLGRKIEKLEYEQLAKSMFPEERQILAKLPQKERSVNFDPSLIEDRIGTMCKNGLHKLNGPEDFYFRPNRADCKVCELKRSAESKRRARARAAAERAKLPKPPKPKARKPRVKKAPKVRNELTVQQVLKIRADYINDGGSYGWISRTAREYNMGESAIRAIIHRRTWKDV